MSFLLKNKKTFLNITLGLILQTNLINAQILNFESSEVANLSNYDNTPSFAGLGEYEIFLDTQNEILDKPIIIVESFDPGDTQSISNIYSSFNYTDMNGSQNLPDYLRSQGFDIVILNFPQYLRLADNSLLHINDVSDNNNDNIIDENDYPDGSIKVDGGTDFIERNAMLLVDLINKINNDKTGNENLVVIGQSMGGLISRYALNFMENKGQDHKTRLWISFDAPHHGANIPIGFQHQLNYLAFGLGDSFNLTALQPIINAYLKSPAAKQLLIDHLDTHLLTTSDVEFDPNKLTPTAHPYRDIFMKNINELTNNGFPQNTRNIAVINGSGTGKPYFAIGNSGTTVSPGFSVLDTTIPIGTLSTNATLKINYSPSIIDKTQLVSSLLITSLGGLITIANSNANSQSILSDGVDAAPGGLFNISNLLNNVDTLGDIGSAVFDALTVDKFNFIPSISGLALTTTDNEINWYHNIDLGTPLGKDIINETPFVNWHFPDTNEFHLERTKENIQFIIDEIITTDILSINSNEKTELRLEKNPVTDHISIINSSTVVNTSLSITDITGKTIYGPIHDFRLSPKTRLSIDLNPGMYILNITNGNMKTFTTKIIVN